MNNSNTVNRTPIATHFRSFPNPFSDRIPMKTTIAPNPKNNKNPFHPEIYSR
jgi:hypothetical protein